MQSRGEGSWNLVVVDCLEDFAEEEGDPKLPSNWKALGWLSMPQMHGSGPDGEQREGNEGESEQRGRKRVSGGAMLCS